jgi:hypothetical protein
MNIKLIEFAVTDPLPTNFPVYGSVGFVDYLRDASLFAAGDAIYCPVRASLGRGIRELYVNFNAQLFNYTVSAFSSVILNHLWGSPTQFKNDLTQLISVNLNFVLILAGSLEDFDLVRQLGAGSFYTVVVTYDAGLDNLKVV